MKLSAVEITEFPPPYPPPRRQGAPPSSEAAVNQELVAMEQEGGVYVVPVRLNGAITLNAVVDSGASDVSIPADVVLTLMRAKTISDEDFLGEQTYALDRMFAVCWWPAPAVSKDRGLLWIGQSRAPSLARAGHEGA
jgi:hypothetical protein